MLRVFFHLAVIVFGTIIVGFWVMHRFTRRIRSLLREARPATCSHVAGGEQVRIEGTIVGRADEEEVGPPVVVYRRERRMRRETADAGASMQTNWVVEAEYVESYPFVLADHTGKICVIPERVVTTVRSQIEDTGEDELLETTVVASRQEVLVIGLVRDEASQATHRGRSLPTLVAPPEEPLLIARQASELEQQWVRGYRILGWMLVASGPTAFALTVAFIMNIETSDDVVALVVFPLVLVPILVICGWGAVQGHEAKQPE
jgi:hypothetical protein